MAFMNLVEVKNSFISDWNKNLHVFISLFVNDWNDKTTKNSLCFCFCDLQTAPPPSPSNSASLPPHGSDHANLTTPHWPPPSEHAPFGHAPLGHGHRWKRSSRLLNLHLQQQRRRNFYFSCFLFVWNRKWDDGEVFPE